MKKVMEPRGGALVLVEYLHQDPEPPHRPLSSAYFEGKGYTPGKGNTYIKENISIRYDGVVWWCFYWAAEFKINTIEEFEKLLQ